MDFPCHIQKLPMYTKARNYSLRGNFEGDFKKDVISVTSGIGNCT
jgi:hypothetical protein